jgi:N-acetylmuramoyl-L-alanine amidase CwlA
MAKRTKTKKRRGCRRVLLLSLVLLVLAGVVAAKFIMPIDANKIVVPSWIKQEIIQVDGASRTGHKTRRIKNIVVHYVGNPGTTAQENRDYFDSAQSTVSSHFVVGIDGEIIQCIPLSEQSAASNNRNIDTISIEVCHPDETGEFSIPAYNATVKLCVWLCQEFGLNQEDIIRHYDVTGKLCPKYYVAHPDAWIQFKEYVKERL